MPPYPLVSLGSPRGDNVRVHTHMGVRVYVSRMGVCHGVCVCVCVCVCGLVCMRVYVPQKRKRAVIGEGERESSPYTRSVY